MQIVHIVFMGDSITAGKYVAAPARWTDIISDRLERTYIDTPVNFFTVARGVSGDTTRQGLERFPQDMQALAPGILTLQFGLNDCNCWVTDRGLPRVSEAAYRANLVEMIDRARRFKTRHIILSTNHPTLRHKVLASGDSLEQRRERYNAIVRDVAAAKGVTLCDMDLAFAGLDLPQHLLAYPDLIHLSVRGHLFYADQIYGHIVRAVQDLANLGPAGLAGGGGPRPPSLLAGLPQQTELAARSGGTWTT